MATPLQLPCSTAARRLRAAARGALATALLVLAAGCASTSWAPRTARPKAALQWPPAPAPAKLVYVESLTGFAPNHGGSVWHTVVYGRGPKGAEGFVLPVAVATGSDGRIAVADLGRRAVELFLPAGQRHLRLTGTKQQPLVSPVGLVFDEANRLFVTDSTGALLGFAPDGTLSFRLDHAGTAKLQRPTGIAYAPDGQRLYVVDTLAARVDVFSTDGVYEHSFGKRGDGLGELNFPTHIARAADGDLLVTDTLNFRIETFDPAGKPLGAFGHHGDGSGDFGMPKGVSVDRDGVVYVVDAMFDNVQLFDRAGRFLLTLGGRGVDFGEFWLPSGIFLSKDDELYVCDTYNHRVQIFRVAEGYAGARS